MRNFAWIKRSSEDVFLVEWTHTGQVLKISEEWLLGCIVTASYLIETSTSHWHHCLVVSVWWEKLKSDPYDYLIRSDLANKYFAYNTLWWLNTLENTCKSDWILWQLHWVETKKTNLSPRNHRKEPKRTVGIPWSLPKHSNSGSWRSINGPLSTIMMNIYHLQSTWHNSHVLGAFIAHHKSPPFVAISSFTTVYINIYVFPHSSRI